MTKGLSSLLIGLVLFLLPLSAQAENAEVPLFSTSSRISILYPLPDVVYFYDQHGNSVILYRQLLGLVWYSARDSSGRIVQEGYTDVPPHIFDPSEIPSANREAPDPDLR